MIAKEHFDDLYVGIRTEVLRGNMTLSAARHWVRFFAREAAMDAEKEVTATVKRLSKSGADRDVCVIDFDD